MLQMLRLTIAIAFALATFPVCVSAQVTAKQIKLSDKQIESFIAAKKDMAPVVERMMQGAFSQTATAKYEAELMEITKKNGFKSTGEYEAVAVSISLVMAAIDPQTRVFTDPRAAIKKELEEVSIDKAIPTSERKKLLRSLNTALRSARPIQFPDNVELVQKYYDKMDVTTVATHDRDSWRDSDVAQITSE